MLHMPCDGKSASLLLSTGCGPADEPWLLLCAQDDESDLEDGDVDDEEDEDDEEEEEEEEGAQLITGGPSRSSSLAEGDAVS